MSNKMLAAVTLARLGRFSDSMTPRVMTTVALALMEVSAAPSEWRHQHVLLLCQERQRHSAPLIVTSKRALFHASDGTKIFGTSGSKQDDADR